MIADIFQNVAVVMIVLAAIGYLVVAWRRGESCGEGGCSCDALSERNRDSEDTLASTPRKQQFVFSDDLAERARKCARANTEDSKDDANRESS